jgi:hypothetical protein
MSDPIGLPAVVGRGRLGRVWEGVGRFATFLLPAAAESAAPHVQGAGPAKA